jgi:hypothetical protein
MVIRTYVRRPVVVVPSIGANRPAVSASPPAT